MKKVMQKAIRGALIPALYLFTTHLHSDAYWIHPGSGLWDSNDSWNIGHPPTGADDAYFTTQPTSAASITLHNPGTAKGLYVETLAPCSFTGNGITLAQFLGFKNGTHVFNVPITFPGDCSLIGITPAKAYFNGSVTAHNCFILGMTPFVALDGVNNFTTLSLSTSAYVQFNNSASLGGAGTPVTIDQGCTLEGTVTTTIPQPIAISNSHAFFSALSGTTATFSGVISGPGQLVKNGAGTIALTNSSNSYMGGTLFNAGTVQVDNATYFGNTAATLTFNGGTLRTTASFSVTTHPIATVSNAIFDVDSGTLTLSSVISGGGSIEKRGAGTLNLTNGSNSYSGGTIIHDGGLNISSDTQLGSGSGSITFTGGGTLNVTAPITLPRTIIMSGSGNIDAFGVALTLSGPLSGAGTVTLSGTGPITLSGTNTHAGTTVDNTTLEVSSEANIGSNTGTLTLNQAIFKPTGTFSSASTRTTQLINTSTFDVDPILTINGPIQGSGGFIKEGTGTLILEGVNTYGGLTTISTGVLQGTALSFPGNIMNSSALLFSQTTTSTYTGDISGTGTVSKSGSGRVNLTGTNSYSGGTTVLQGVLGGTTNSLQGNISVDPLATLTFNQNSDGTFVGAISGMGNVTKEGTGTLTFDTPHTYSGLTTIAGGALKIASDSIVSNIVNNSSLIFDQTSNGMFSFTISGSGAVEKRGSAILVFTEANSYTGGTTISDGTLQGSTNTIPGDVSNNATLLFVQNFDGVFAGNITGSGALVKEGTGSVTLTGINFYSGGTSINQGTIQCDTFSLPDDVDVSGALIFNQDFDGFYLGTITGVGNVQKLGSGTVSIFGDSPFLGLTTVSAGTVVLNGSLGGDISVEGGGSFKGNCTAVNLTNNGKVAPGNSIGVMNYVNFTQGSSGLLEIEVDPDGNSDLINVSNLATLDGTLHAVPGPGLYEGFETYTIMTYASRSSTFATLTSSINSPVSVNYLPTSIQINVGYRGAVTPLPVEALPYNPRQVANYLFCQNFVPTDPDLKYVMKQLLALTPSQFAAALDDFDPRQFGAIPQVELQNHHLLSDVLIQQSHSSRWCSRNKASLWITPVGQWLSEKGYSDQLGFVSQTYGGLLGASYSLDEKLLFNGGVSYTHSHLGWKKNGGKGFWNTIYLAPAVTYFHENWQVSGVVQASYSHYSIYREIDFPGLHRTAHNRHNGYGLLARADGGYKIGYYAPNSSRPINLIPTLRLSYYNQFEAGFTEHGADSLNLAVSRKQTSYLQPEFLVQLYREYSVDQLCIVPSLHLGWIGNYPLSSRLVKSQFSLDEPFCESSFSVRTYHKNTNQLTASLHLLIKHTDHYQLDFGYDGRYFDGLLINSAKVSFEYRF